MITFEEIKKDPGIRTYIQKADESLINLGFTEHSFAHVGLVAANSKYILETLGYTPREVELVQIAAYLHDIGNLVNRIDHSQSGAVMAFRLLDHLHMDPLDIAEVVTAIGNHDEGNGVPVTYVSCTPVKLHPIALSVERARRLPLWRVVEIASGHNVHLHRPDDVAEILMECAERA